MTTKETFQECGELQLLKEKFRVRKVVGILGSSKNRTTYPKLDVVSTSFCELVQEGHRFAILTGGTRGGIPELGLKVAKQNNLPTIGVFPQDGEKYALIDQLDLAIKAPHPIFGEILWGSETALLVSCLDAAIIIGGEWGTVMEISMIMKINSSRLKKPGAKLPIMILPISGSGGIADEISNLAKKFDAPATYILPIRDSIDLSLNLINILGYTSRTSICVE